MQTDLRRIPPARLQTLAAMAGLLERLESQPSSASAEQYQGVVRQVATLLEQATPGDDLDALLRVAPATAELYENLRYEVAGLCRSPLDRALNAELAATAAIEHCKRVA